MSLNSLNPRKERTGLTHPTHLRALPMASCSAPEPEDAYGPWEGKQGRSLAAGALRCWVRTRGESQGYETCNIYDFAFV